MIKIFTIVAALVVAGVGATAYFMLDQRPTAEAYRVGIVSYGGAHTEAVEGLRSGMRMLGYQEGVTIEYDIVDAEGSLDNVRAAAARFEQEGFDAVYPITTPITQAVAEDFSGPVVFNIVSDPVGAGIAAEWLSSGNHTTGCSNYVGQTGPKRLEILRDVLPEVETVLVLYDPENAFSVDAIIHLREAVNGLDITLAEEHIYSGEDVVAFLENIEEGEYDAFFHLGEAKVSGVAEDVVRLVNEARLPSIAHAESFAERGMLISYGPSWHYLGEQCASVVDKVLRGTPPAEIPIQIPEQIDLIINQNTADLLGIELSVEDRLRADRVIE